MSKWTMKGTTGETVKVTPEEFRRYWDMGYRPVSDRQTASNDYQQMKKRGNNAQPRGADNAPINRSS